MTITYPLTLPTQTGIASVELEALNAVAISQSPFSFKQQVVAFSGQRFGANVTLPPMKRADAEVWISFLISLKGQVGTFLMGDPNCATPQGSASTNAGTPLVNGSTQTGATLSIDGLPASATGYLKAGDYIQLGSGTGTQLYKVLADVDSTAGGNATIDIYPNLRSSPADDATVIVSNAKGLFRLANPQTNWSINNASFYGITFSAIEVLT